MTPETRSGVTLRLKTKKSATYFLTRYPNVFRVWKRNYIVRKFSG